MLLHPHVLTKAQEEIDRVVGPKRLPDFDDRESLPYIEAIFQEVLRCVLPRPFEKPACSRWCASRQMAPRRASR